jgi:F-type H+-transporting ATPase subunit delta
MMSYSEAANRYAQAMFELAQEDGGKEIIFDQLREVRKAFVGNADIESFFSSPVVSAASKLQVINNTLKELKLHPLVERLLELLCQKNRLSLFTQLVLAYQDKADAVHGVIRGTVRSASTLQAEESKNIETIVSKVTQKKVILTYTQDPALLGGLVAQVGSYTFDDSLDSHLHRIRDELKRRTH